MSLADPFLTDAFVTVARIGGLTLAAGFVTGLVSFIYRSRVRTQFPDGATLVVGWGVVALYLNTRLVFVQYVGAGAAQLTVGEAALNIAALALAAIASYGGRHIGDRIGRSNTARGRWFQPSLSPIVRATGRFISVDLPTDIDDIVGYDPVPSETKEFLAGRQLDFPRGLTIDELESQLVERLKEAHGIGYVDVEVGTAGAVEYLAVGQRPAGIGPTLPPDSAAVAVRADPPFSASAGDTVQLHKTGAGTDERLGMGELRASVGSLVTLALDEGVAVDIDPEDDHRLMTLSATSNPDREFAAMLRREDETLGIVEIGSNSPIVGSPIGALDITIIAIRDAGGTIETIPARSRLLSADDALFAIGRPEALRRLESLAAVSLEEATESSVGSVRGIDLEPSTD